MGAEAAIHSARSYLSEIPSDLVMVKLDFKNAFNSIRRDAVLKACLEHPPELYPLVFSYSSYSYLSMTITYSCHKKVSNSRCRSRGWVGGSGGSGEPPFQQKL
jgi:hypothetical protein